MNLELKRMEMIVLLSSQKQLPENIARAHYDN